MFGLRIKLGFRLLLGLRLKLALSLLDSASNSSDSVCGLRLNLARLMLRLIVRLTLMLGPGTVTNSCTITH